MLKNSLLTHKNLEILFNNLYISIELKRTIMKLFLLTVGVFLACAVFTYVLYALKILKD